MTAQIIRVNSQEAYDLLFTEHLSTLSNTNIDTMQRTFMNSSRIWLGADDDKIIAMWGLIPPTLMSDIAYLWLFTTKHLNSHVFMFIRHSQRAVADMLKEFPTIVGHTERSNRRAQQWLKWLGAEFEPGPNDAILSFTIKASQQCHQQHSVQSA